MLNIKMFTKQHNAVIICYLSVNLLTNVIVRLTTTVDYMTIIIVIIIIIIIIERVLLKCR